MGTCKMCGTSGTYVKTNRMGLCEPCGLSFDWEITYKNRQLMDSIAQLNQDISYKERLQAINLAISTSAEFATWQSRGISFSKTNFGQYTSQLKLNRDQLITDWLWKEFSAAQVRSSTASTDATRISPFTKLLSTITKTIEIMTNKSLAQPVMIRTNHEINQIKLNNYLMAAGKAEYKGLKNKAIDAYFEALYFLEHDQIDDQQQAQTIEYIKNKIKGLGGTIPGKVLP